MSILFRLRALFIVTLKRLWAQRGLTLAITIGLVAAVALIMAVPLYSDAVYYRILHEELSRTAEVRRKPPFAYNYDYVGSWSEPVQWEDIEAIDEYLTGPGMRYLGLPLDFLVRHFETERFKLYPAGTTDYSQENSSLGVFNFTYVDGIENHIMVIDGEFPQPAISTPDSMVNILVTDALAEELGLQVGDVFTAYNFRDANATMREIPVRVAGVWQAINPNDAFWYFGPQMFSDLLLVPEDTFVNRFSPYMSDEVNRAIWHLVMDGSRVDTTDVNSLVARAQRVERRADTLLPEIRNRISPVEALVDYHESFSKLNVTLSAFNIPIIFLVLAFIVLIVGLAVDQRRNEIAVMRSRGATRIQIVGFAVLEGVALGIFAFILGTAVALLLTQLMGKTRSFLDFSASSTLRIALTSAGVRAGLIAVSLAILAQVLPTISASRSTIVSYKQEQARSLARPWWQRAWLDVLMLIPAIYGFYLLQQQGTLITLDSEAAATGDPLQNPLLFLIPVLTVFSLTLLFIRVLPYIMELLARLLVHTDSVGILMAIRQLARTPRVYAMPLILLVLTASLAVFTASLAQTMDYQLFDRYLYEVGSDLSLRGAGRPFGPSSPFADEEEEEGPDNRAIFLPLSEYEEFPDVEAAARVGNYSSRAQVGNNRISGTYIGIDREDFGDVAYWRWDFADYRLGTLLNAMAASPDAILVSRDFARESGLRPGDYFRLDVNLPEATVELNTHVVGIIDYFPSWYPEEDGPLFVGNLEALFSQAGGEFPYRVWMRTNQEPDEGALEEALRERRLIGWRFEEPYSDIEKEQYQPDRQGVFGLLSVGFGAAALLTVLGFFMYALFSFRRRFITLGILRAVGLSARQMTIFVACELAFLILTGLTLGTLLGAAISQMFIPYLQFGSNEAELVPPYLVEMAWPAVYQVYILFALLFVVALIVLAILLRRMKIFQAIKLGETA